MNFIHGIEFWKSSMDTSRNFPLNAVEKNTLPGKIHYNTKISTFKPQ